jgi:hypothetical protein
MKATTKSKEVDTKSNNEGFILRLQDRSRRLHEENLKSIRAKAELR